LRETETVHGPRHVNVTEEYIDGKVLVPKDEDSLVGVGRLDNPVAAVAQVLRYDETEQNFVFDDEYLAGLGEDSGVFGLMAELRQ